ncbi:MAG: NTP transferase domain-containing protein [Actinobacteria bacterium]|nr:NTP transferase domain-containing protein [Actinomycetota bacterium]
MVVQVGISSILLAAGRGERLRPLTDLVPKAALPLLDVPLGRWGLRALERVAPPVVVNASWLAPAVGRALGGGGVEIFVEEPEAYGTAGTLKALESRLADRVLVHNCDLVTDLDPADLLDAHRRNGAPATVAVRDVDSGADLLHDGGRATGFVDRRLEQRPGASYIGVGVFEREVLARLDDDRPLGLGETLLKQLADTGGLAVFPHTGYRADVGTPVSFLETSIDVLNGRAPGPPRELPGRIVQVVGGKAYLGPGATAAGGTLGPGAIVLAGAHVRPRARVEGAVVWTGVTIASGREVRDAIALDDRDLY